MMSELERYLLETMKQILELHSARLGPCACGQCYQARMAVKVAEEEMSRRIASLEAAK